MIRVVSSIKVGTKRKLRDNIKPISCAGTLSTSNGFNKDSTASAKLNGVVVKVSNVEKKIIKTNLIKISAACCNPRLVMLKIQNEKITCPPCANSIWKRVVNKIIPTIGLIPLKK